MSDKIELQQKIHQKFQDAVNGKIPGINGKVIKRATGITNLNVIMGISRSGQGYESDVQAVTAFVQSLDHDN